MTLRLNDGIISNSMKNVNKYPGNRSQDSPVTKKFNFFVFYLTRAEVQYMITKEELRNPGEIKLYDVLNGL